MKHPEKHTERESSRVSIFAYFLQFVTFQPYKEGKTIESKTFYETSS